MYGVGHCSASGTPWQYLTVQLTRESEDLAGDPDLYGLFYGGTAGAVWPCRALRAPREAQPSGAHAFLAYSTIIALEMSISCRASATDLLPLNKGQPPGTMRGCRHARKKPALQAGRLSAILLLIAAVGRGRARASTRRHLGTTFGRPRPARTARW